MSDDVGSTQATDSGTIGLTDDETAQFCEEAAAFAQEQSSLQSDPNEETRRRATSVVNEVLEDIEQARQKEQVPVVPGGEKSRCRDCFPEFVRSTRRGVSHEVAMREYTTCVSTCK